MTAAILAPLFRRGVAALSKAAKAPDTKLGEELKALVKLHLAVAWDGLGDDKLDSADKAQERLSALEDAARRLSLYPEKKALVYFSSGVEKTGVDNQSQLRATINSAIRNNVSFYPIDARGLVAEAPLGDATKASSGGQGMLSGRRILSACAV